jgi:hypothetical protein
VRSSKILGILLLVCGACAPESPPAAAPSPAAAPPAPSAPAAPATPSAPATPDDVVAANRSGLDACYAKARTLDPKLGHTKVEMTFTIDPDGKPKNVDFKYNRLVQDAAKDCMRDAALGLHFPPSMQGTQTATVHFAPN